MEGLPMRLCQMFETVLNEITYQRFNTVVKGMKGEQVTFGNRHELKRIQSTIDTYVFQTSLFRFTQQYIDIAKVDGINNHTEISIRILEQIQRKVSQNIKENCIIEKVFVQDEKVYLFISIGKQCFFVQIIIPKSVLDLSNIFNRAIRVGNPQILEIMKEKCVISHKMFFEEHDQSNGLVFILMKNQQNDAFALLKGIAKHDGIQFKLDQFESKDLKCQFIFNNILFSRSHFAFVKTCGQIRVYQIAKGTHQYKQKDELKLTIQDQIRRRREVNNSSEERLVATCEVQAFVYFLFVVNSSKYTLLRWKKDGQFANLKQFTKYSIPNNFENPKLTFLTCLAESQGRCVMVLSQCNLYFLLDFNTGEQQAKVKVRRIGTDANHAYFGIHNGILCLFQRESYSQALFEIDPISKSLQFSSCKPNKQSMAMSSRQQSVILKSSLEVQQINQFAQKGNNRLAISDHNMAPECLSEQQIQRQESSHKRPYSNQVPHQQPIPPFPLTIHQNANIPHSPHPISQSNPMNILSSLINPNQPIFNDINGNFPSFNPNSIVNIHNNVPIDSQTIPPSPSAGGCMSFGVPPLSPIQQANESITEPAIQVPAISRGFSFGDSKIKEQPVQPKKPLGRMEPKRNLKLLQKLSLGIQRYESAMNHLVQDIGCIGRQSQKFDLKELFSNNRVKQEIIGKNVKFWFNSRQDQYNKTLSELKDQFEDSFQSVTNNINRKIHQFGLNNKKRSKNSQLTSELWLKNDKIVQKSIISFKLKLSRLGEEVQTQLKCIQSLSISHIKWKNEIKPQK